MTSIKNSLGFLVRLEKVAVEEETAAAETEKKETKPKLSFFAAVSEALADAEGGGLVVALAAALSGRKRG